MKKLLAPLLACVLLIGTFAACSNNPSESSSGSGSGTSSGGGTSEEPKGEIIGENVQFDTGKEMEGELNVWFYEDGKRFIQPLFDDYQKYRPNVKLNVTYVAWGDYWTKIPVEVSGGNGPDVFYFHNSYQNLMVDSGLMKPYSDELVEALRKDYKGVDSYAALDGNIYYIATGGGHGVIYYNKALWADAGLTEEDIPETWEEFREIAMQLTQKEGDSIKVAGFNYTPASAFINDWSLLSGRFLFSEDGKQLLFDNDDFKKSMQFFVDMYLVDGICSPTFPDAEQSFKDGTSAMIWNHPYFAGILRGELPDFEFGVFPQPRFEDKERNWHYNNPDVSMGINAQCDEKQTELAEDLLTLFFASDKYMLDWCKEQCLAPTKISLEDNEELASDPVIKVLMEDYDNSIYVGPTPNQMGQDLVQTLLDPVLLSGVSIDEALPNAVAKVNQTLADYNWKPAECDSAIADELK